MTENLFFLSAISIIFGFTYAIIWLITKRIKEMR